MGSKRYFNRLWQVRDGLNVKRYNQSLPPITQEILAQKCGVSRQTIISIENHEQMPTYPLAIRIFAFFSSEGIKINYLFPIPPLENSLDKKPKTGPPSTIEAQIAYLAAWRP